MRNLAVALGNGPGSEAAVAALEERRGQISELVDEHIDWALEQLQQQRSAQLEPIFTHHRAKRLPK